MKNQTLHIFTKITLPWKIHLFLSIIEIPKLSPSKVADLNALCIFIEIY